MTLCRLTLTAAAVVSFAVHAADAGKSAEPAKKEEKKEAAAAAPTLPPEGKKWIESNLGNWKSTDATLTLGDKPLKGKLTMKCDKAAGGWATVCNAKFDFGKELPGQDSTFLMAWNLGTGEATMFEASNVGDVHHHTGKWADDKSITVVHNGKNAEGKDEKDSLTFTFSSPKELVLKGEGTSGGQTLWTFAATAKK
jgi:hypothetical protein